MENPALELAISRFPSQNAFASALGVKSPSVSEWKKRKNGTPAERCPAIEALTGVRCEDLLETVEWTRGEDGKVTGYHTPISTKAA